MIIIDKKCIVFDLQGKTKFDIIKNMVVKLKAIDAISDIDSFYYDVIQRELICPTFIGHQIGLPHGKSNNVLKTSICFGRLHEPVLWDEASQKSVKHVLLIAVPEEASQLHMKIISSLARKLIHEKYRNILQNGNQNEIYELLNNAVNIYNENGLEDRK